MKYVDVILPLPVSGAFTYVVPDEWAGNVQIGMRVIVAFGVKKLYTGIITLIHTQVPELYKAKEILGIPDTEPILKRPQYKLWEWISEYYMSTIGEVYQAAIPSGLKLESETSVCINPDFEAEEILSAREQQVLDALSDARPHTIATLNRYCSTADIMPAVKRLLDKGAVEIHEAVSEKFRIKTATCIRLPASYADQESLRKLFDNLAKAPKQLTLLMHYLEASGQLKAKELETVYKKDLLEKTGINPSVLRGMVDKGIFEIYRTEIGRLERNRLETTEPFPLNPFQQKAFSDIEKQFVEKQVVLLHGVTSAGKTEIYIHLIKKVLAEGRQVLYLVPEIALTTQLTCRLKQIFGNRLGVYHSKFSDAERVEIWNEMLRNQSYDIILGVRSSIFLPFRHLGLVIIDEEHEPSFKQQDPAPRYHARDAAIVLANMHGAKTLLGTATPSIESYFNARTGKYGFVELLQRHGNIQLPEIEAVDMKEAYRKKQFESFFSDVLLEKIKKALQNKEQVILFQNRRGYAPFVECKACAYIPKCKNCDVSLTMHAAAGTLNCHYCGYIERMQDTCPVCKTPGLNPRGFGTEKIEEEIKKIFPKARVLRMDADTTRSKKAYRQIIAAVDNYKVDILIGTQMVTKGLDFEKVSLVGILNADNLLNFPDFRAHERAFQLMSQVSGRAGRKHKRGLVVIQTMAPGHPIVTQVLHHDYQGMYNRQTEERRTFKYPPYFRMIQISLRHRNNDIVERAAREMAQEMRLVFGERVLGPVIPVVSRVQNLFIRQILFKIETTASLKTAKTYLQNIIMRILSKPSFKSIKISNDVDPG